MCPWAPSSLRSYRLLHKALPAGETWAWTVQNETFCTPERAFPCRTVPYLCKGKKSRPCKGQATGWSLTYSGARRAVGPGAAACADLPLLRRPSAQAPHLAQGPAAPRRQEGERGPAAVCPTPAPIPSLSGGQRSLRARPRALPRGSETRATRDRPATVAHPAADRTRSVRRRRRPPRTPTHQGGRGGELGASEHLSGRRPEGHDPASLRREGEGEGTAGGGGDGRGWRE